MRRLAVPTLVAAVLSPAAPAGTVSRGGSAPPDGTRFRLIAYDYKQRLEDTETYDLYVQNLRDQIGAAQAHFTSEPPTLAFLPEDAGLMAWLVGPRGEPGRQAAMSGGGSVGAIAALGVGYQSQIGYYETKCPGIPPARALILALTDTAWRAFAEPLAALAREWGIWIMANLNAPDVAVTRDPAKVQVLADPEQASKGYAYEAAACEHWNTAFLFPPTATLDPDGAADPARVVHGAQKKIYLVPIERTQDVGLAMSSESPANARAIDTPFGGLGVLTSKDAWMTDVVERLAVDGMDVFLQPEAGPWAGHGEGLPDWPPDGMTRAVWSMVQWRPETRWGALSNLTGNFGDLYFDGTATVVRDADAGEIPARYLLGRLPQPGMVARADWVFPDPPPGATLEDVPARRAFLDENGARLTPGSGDPMENGQLSGFVVVDVDVPQPAGTRRARRRFLGSRAVDPNDGPQWSPSLASAGGEVYVAWTDLRGGSESPRVAASVDRGRSWDRASKAGDSSARPLDQQDNQYDVRVAATGEGVTAMWVDFRNQSWDIRGARSPDGRDWSASVRVDGSPSSAEGFPNENLHQDPTIAALPDGRMVAAWSDARGRRVDRGIVVSRSTDGGRSWKGEAAADGTGYLDADQWSPALATGRGGDVVLAWQDHRDGFNQVYVALSRDGGESFGPPVRIAPSTRNQFEPSVAMSRRGRVAVALSEEAADPGERRILLAETSVQELTRTAKDRGPRIRIRRPDARRVRSPLQARPAVDLVGRTVILVWQERTRAGDWDVVATRVGRGSPVRVDDGPAGTDARLPALLMFGRRVIVGWEDTRSGEEQVRVSSAPIRRLG